MNAKFLRYVAYFLLLFALVMAFIPDRKPTENTKVEQQVKNEEKVKKSFLTKNTSKKMSEEEAKAYMKNNSKMNIVSLVGCGVFLVLILVKNRKNL